MENKNLTTTNQMSLSDLKELGQQFFISKLFPDITDAAQAVVKIAAGKELDFPPVYSMTKIFIVKGKVMVSSEAMGVMVKRSRRYDYHVVKLTDAECELMFTDDGRNTYLSRFTIDDAKRAGIMKDGGGWYTWPRAMLMSKALSQGARIVCPHVIAGAYTPEDFGVETDDEGNIVEGKAQAVVDSIPQAEKDAEVLFEDKQGTSGVTETTKAQETSEPHKPKYKRDPESIKSLNQLITVCKEDFVMPASETFKELNLKSSRDYKGKPSEDYKKIAAVRD